VAEAASAAIAAGAALSAIADAERTGQLRARRALSPDVLRHVTSAAKRKREADSGIREADSGIREADSGIREADSGIREADSGIREADSEYEQAIARAGRIGLSHRDIATAAEVSHGTVRAILARSSASLNGNDQQTVTAAAAAMDDGAS
jgi:DNA-binding NarL/FixJ family response regulator